MTVRPAQRAAGLSLLVTLALVIVKGAVWMATDSLAVLSQTLDSLLDVVALGLLFLGVRISAKPADEEHHYGHGKAENLVAFTQTLLIGLVVIAVAVTATGQLRGPEPDVHAPWYALVLLGASVVIDAGRAAALLQVGRRESSDAFRAGALNIASDVGTALVTLVSLVIVRTGATRADAWGALIVAIVVAFAAVRLGKRSVDVLMDTAPAAPTQLIEDAAAGAEGVREARRVRVRRSGDRLFADVTVAAGRTHSLEHAHDIAERVEDAIEAAVPGTDVVVHVEPAED